MSEEKNDIQLEEENSFFESEYQKYASKKRKTRKEPESCATASLSLDDITTIFGIENTTMLKDYETASTRMTHLTKSVQDHTDQKIDELKGHDQDSVRSDYEFDPDEITIGEMIRINAEFLKKQLELADTPKEPYVANVLAAFPGEPTEKIAVIAVPEEAIASDESPFISVDDIRDDE